MLQDDDKYEFADPSRIQGLVKNYSQFVSFPIYTWQEKSRTVEVGLWLFFQHISTLNIIVLFPFYTNVLLFEQVEEEEESKEGEEASEVSYVYIWFCWVKKVDSAFSVVSSNIHPPFIVGRKEEKQENYHWEVLGLGIG